MLRDLPSASGTYALVFGNTLSRTVRVGALDDIDIGPGYLVYVGSAFGPGGIRARIERHARSDKRLHWHIDYLGEYLSLEEALFTTAPERMEHAWAEALARLLEIAAPRFGASDCRCDSHLFYSKHRPELALPKQTGVWRIDR